MAPLNAAHALRSLATTTGFLLASSALALGSPQAGGVAVPQENAAGGGVGPGGKALGGDSPFVDVPLPFESLKAPPDSAFEILMISFGVFFLVVLAIAAFLTLSKLGSLVELYERELRRQRDERDASGGAVAPDAAPDAAPLLDAASFEAGVARIEKALESALEEARRSASDASSDRALRSSAEGEGADAAAIMAPADAARASEAIAEAVRSAIQPLAGDLSAGLDRLRGTLVRSAGSTVPPGTTEAAPQLDEEFAPTTAVVLDRVHTRLAALGFVDVEVVTPRDEIDEACIAGGELRVEARRSGSIHKGTVSLEDGAPADVRMRPGHTMFP